MAVLVLGAPAARAQGGTGFSDYFVLGQDHHVFQMMSRVQGGEGAAAFPTPSRMNSVVSATATSDDQIIYFDHWEDGLELNIREIDVVSITRSGAVATVTTSAAHGYATGMTASITGAVETQYNGSFVITVTGANSFTYPVAGTPATPATTATALFVQAHQASTQVFGDANSANGRACDFTNDPRVTCGGANPDKLFAGTAMSFSSDQGMASATCSAQYAIPPSLAQLGCSFPIPPTVTGIANPAANVARVTANAHNFPNGARVRISGATPAVFNGEFVIFNRTANTFDYTIVGSPGVAAAAPVFSAVMPTIRFDGGDRVFSTGGSLSIAHVQDPGTPLIGGGTELISRELVKNAVAFSIPVGENLFPGPAATDSYSSVKYVSLDIVAFDDNTSITVTSPGGGGGVVSLVLHRGQHYTTCATFAGATAGGTTGGPGTCSTGAIDGPAPPSGFAENRGVATALALKINSGTKISNSGPLNALIFTGGGDDLAAGTAAYQTRHYATLPDILHTTDYVTTAPGDVAGSNGSRPMNLFIYNPNPTLAINVTRTDTAGTSVLNVPANTVINYRDAVGALVPAGSTVRLTSNRPFWGLSSYDAQAGVASDWGHAWLGVRFLKSDYTLAYSPGTQHFAVTNVSKPAGAGATVTLTLSISATTIPVGSRILVSGIPVINGVDVNGQFTLVTNLAGPPSTITYVLPGFANNVPSQATNGTMLGMCDSDATAPCAFSADRTSFNRDPVWVAGTQNNTQVRADLDADGLWDFIDTDGDGCPNAGTIASTSCETPIAIQACAVPTPAVNCAYVVNSPGNAGVNALRVWDPYDYNNAGTRIVTTRPVALSWGQDVDRAGNNGGDPSPDNGYTVYPSIAVDLVLGIEKDVAPSRQPLTGGVANYTVRVFAGDYGPITFVSVRDLLPDGLTCANYVAGSTLITYPDLSTTNVPPVCADNAVGTRSQLTWSPTPATLNINQSTTITYQLNIPSTTKTVTALAGGGTATATATSTAHGFIVGQQVTISGATSAATNQYNGTFTIASVPNPNQFTYTMAGIPGSPSAGGTITAVGGARSYENEAEVFGNLGSSIFNPKDTATFVQSNLNISKTVSTATASVGDVITYTVAVVNSGPVETNVSVSDAIPPFTSFVGAASLNAATAVTSISQTAGLATVTMPTPHGYVNNATVTIAGAAPAAYNGAKVITVTSPTTFTFAIAPATTSPATGVITATPSTAGLTGVFSGGSNAVVWSAATLAANAVAILTFQVTVDASTATGSIIPNSAEYSSSLISLLDSNEVETLVLGPQLSITKNGPSGPLHPTESGTFELVVTNSGTSFARNLVITDNVSGGNLLYTPGTLTWSLNAGPFIALTDASDADEGSVTGTTVTFSPIRSITSLFRSTNIATATTSAAHGFVTGDAVTIAGATSDPALYNGSFSITVLNATQFTYAMAGNPTTSPALGTITADQPLAPGSTIRLRFDATVTGTNGQFASNQATVVATGQPLTTSNFYQVPIVGNATVTGHVFLDLDGNGVQNVGVEPNLPNVTVTITDSSAAVQVVVTDANGNYSVVVPPGSTTLNVDQTDPDIPPGSTLSTAAGCPGVPANCNDPQTVTAIAASTVASANVGYTPPPVSISKVSSGAGTAVPGQILTYTVTVTNYSTQQTGITLADVVPANTTYQNNTAMLSSPAIRVTEYRIDATTDRCTEAGTGFTNGQATCTLTLNQNLQNDYFVIVQGSRDSTTDSRPTDDYVALTSAPAGTPGVGADLTASPAANQIVLSRTGTTNAWFGVVTVVECMNGCDTNGFRLRTIERVAHTNALAASTDTAGGTPWVTLGRVVLFGGANGSGCTTNAVNLDDHHVCHVRLSPSGANVINWSRNAGGLPNPSITTSTVMVVEWGSAWTVQRVNVTGNLGGDGVDATTEYNTAAITSVVRSNTWVWGTGFTDLLQAGNSAEGAVITLGDGVTQLASETLVAVGTEEPGGANTTVNFDVYTMTHSQLAVEYLKKPDGDAGAGPAQAITVTMAAPASANRMALVYNGDNTGTNDEWPTSIFAARYTSNTNIELSRRRSGFAFPAWVQGINFDGITNTVQCGNTNPPAAGSRACVQPSVSSSVVQPVAGHVLPIGETMVLTFQVQVDNPLGSGVTQISNTAGFTSTQTPVTINASAVDNVVRPGVQVEPNNAGFASAGTTILFTQAVTNRGTTTDSFTVALQSELANWMVELIDPATGAVVASDTNGDGIWDGGVSISTGPLAVNESRQFTIRVTVPPGTTDGTQNTVELTATSALSNLVKDVGTDEITVLPAGTFGPVILLPDHSGIVAAGETIAYTHRLFNNTGASGVFDIRADTQLGWTTTVHADTNGDGVYTPGTDLALASSPTVGFLTSATLANGASQILFVVTTAPAGTAPGVEDVAHLTARLRSNPVLVDAVTDTTTVLAPSTALDLAGGGTRFAVAGETTTFPGTLYNLSSSSTRYDIGITPASLFGVDGFNHPTQLRVDTDANGIPDLVIAVDSEGDGVWDQLCGAPLPCSAALYNNNGNDRPDISVGANQDVAYDLVRVIDPNQAIWKEYVTITAASFGGTSTPVTTLTSSGTTATATRAGHGLVVGQTVTIAGATSSGANNYNGTFVVASVPDANTFTYTMAAPSDSNTAGGTISYTVRSEDSVTAQWIIATLSRASIRGLRVDPAGVVEFVTGTQQNTAAFNIYETTERSREGARTLLNSAPVRSPAPDSLLPILYRIETGPVSGPYVLIEEIETTGNTLIYGPYSMENSRLRRGLERVESQMDSFGVAKGAVRVSRQSLGTAGSRRVARDQRLESIPLVTFAASAASAPSALLLETTGSGELSIPLSTLQAAGLPVTSPSALKLRRGGVRIPFALRPSASPTSLDFNAESLATDYTDRNTYTLTWDNFGTPAPTVSVTASFDPSRSGFTRIERNSIYAASAPVGTDPWQWDLLSGDGSTWPYSGFDPLAGQFDLPGLLSGSVGPVPLRLRLVGVSETQHVVRATINGVAIGEVHFEGRTPISLDTTVPAEILRETGNELNLVYDSSVRDGMPIVPGYVYLDYLEIGAPHRPAISTASLAAIRPYDARLPAVGGAKYLIVTHPDFRAEADRLAALKTAEGLKAVVLDVNVAYDRYSGGIVEPLAVRAAVQAVRAVTKFQYLVLIGDDVLDPRNFLGGGTTAFIPSIMGRDNYSRIPNDNAYADLNGDGIPELAIGRLPVATPAEAAAVIDKIEAQTATLTAAANRHLFISDDQRESDAAFADNALAMSETLPASATSVFAEAGSGVGLARTTMFGAWQNGVAMTHYFGHGGPEIWTDEALFSVEDLESLEGSMPPMLLLAWACQSQFYQNYYGPTVNEALFLSPGSGSLASFGPVGITSPDHQRKLYERVYAELYKSGLSIGEIIRRAKVAALAESKANQDVVDGFMFFGDPSLRIPQP